MMRKHYWMNKIKQAQIMTKKTTRAYLDDMRKSKFEIIIPLFGIMNRLIQIFMQQHDKYALIFSATIIIFTMMPSAGSALHALFGGRCKEAARLSKIGLSLCGVEAIMLIQILINM